MVHSAMRLNKKGMAVMETIIGIVLITFVFFILLGLWNKAAGRSEGAAAEELCHATNALRTGIVLKLPTTNIEAARVVPRGCKTLDIQKLPDATHLSQTSDKNKAAISHIADLSAKCWWMWLEGQAGKVVMDPRLFGSKFGSDKY